MHKTFYQKALTKPHPCGIIFRQNGTQMTHLCVIRVIKFNTSRCSAVGSAPVSGTGGLEFESPHFDQKRKESPCGSLFFFDQVRNESSIRAIARRSSHTPCRRVKLACKRQTRVSSPTANTSTSTALSVVLIFFLLAEALFASTPFAPCGIV